MRGGSEWIEKVKKIERKLKNEVRKEGLKEQVKLMKGIFE